MNLSFGKILIGTMALMAFFRGDCLLAQSYTVTPIGSLDDIISLAWKINDRGQVAGWSSQDEPLGATEAVFWSEETGLVGIGQVTGLLDTFGIGISNDGTVAGRAGRAFEDSVSFTWTQADGMTFLPPVGTDILATDINDLGQVVGDFVAEDGIQHGFLFGDGQIVDLGIPGKEPRSSADAINNLGEVLIGTSGNVYIWKDGVFTLQPSLGGGTELGNEINDLGQATGSSRTAGNELRAVIWTDGQVQDLGVLQPASGAFSFAFGINNRGTAIGEAEPGGEFICEEGCPDGMVEINTLLPAGVALVDVFDINNAGQIVGEASIDGGFAMGVVLNPIDPHPVVINPLPGSAGIANNLDLLHFNPNAEVTLFRSEAIGNSSVSGCPDIDLDLDNPEVVATTTVDSDGRGSFTLPIPASDEGQTRFFQAVDLNACEETAIMVHRFGIFEGLFADGFESGNTSAWAQTIGGS